MVKLIVEAAVAGLVLIPAGISAFRRFVERDKPTFVYPADVPAAEARVTREGYLHRCLVALDIFLNVVFFKGYQGITMSSHMWHAAVEGHTWGRVMNFWLNGFQSDHGPQAASGDLERALGTAAIMKKYLGIKP